VLARRTAGENLAPVRFQPGEECGIAQEAVFGDLGIAGAELPRRQRIEQSRVGHHQHRLMKGSDQVFAMPRIDAGLAADRGIHLRQQRGRYLHEIKPAPHRRGGKTREVADHATAERHHEVVALHALRNQVLAHFVEHADAFGAFAGRHDHMRAGDAGRLQRFLRSLEMRARDILVGDDRRLGARTQGRHACAERSQEPAADHDVIGARAECNIDDNRFVRTQRSGHGFAAPSTGPKASRISSTITSCNTSRDSTMTRASA
jgi:hypothetical protein